MPAPFEIHLIHVEWSPNRDVAAVTANGSQLLLEERQGGYRGETQLYRKVSGRPAQIAVKAEEQPSLIRADGTPMPLTPIVDPTTGQRWWIEIDKKLWRAEKKRGLYFYEAPTCSHAGRVTVRVGDTLCEIDQFPPAFDDDEFRQLLQAFDDDLFDLILDADSHTQMMGWGKHTLLAAEGLLALDRFVKSARNVAECPRVELVRSEEFRRPLRARPTAGTFRELARKGPMAPLPVRTSRETANTPENRYVRYLVERVQYLVERLLTSAETRLDRLSRMQSTQQVEIDELNQTIMRGTRTVDLALLDSEIGRLQQRITAINGEWVGRASSICEAIHPERSHSLTIQVLSSPSLTADGCRLTASYKLYNDDSYLPLRPQFVFSRQVAALGVFEQGGEYVIKAEYEVTTRRSFSPEPDETFWMRRIESIRLVSHPTRARLERRLHALEQARAQLRRTGGNRHLQLGERTELEKERSALFHRQQAISETWRRFRTALDPLREHGRMLRLLIRRFDDLGVERSALRPMSVALTQLRPYRAVLSSYHQLINAGRIDEKLMDDVLAAQHQGVEALPVIYERWCLLSLARLLTEDFRFTPTDDHWRERLVQQAVGRHGKSFALTFQNSETQRAVRLKYQCQWQRGRPDYILETFDLRRDDAFRVPDAILVLDAKCKPFGPDFEVPLGDDLHDLEKKYRAFDQPHLIFVVHPSNKALPNARTSQPWAAGSVYGGSRAFGWEMEDFPDHRRGAVILRPRVPCEASHTAALKRLIGMLLEYSCEGEAVRRPVEGRRRIDAHPEHRPFCQVCGSGKISVELKPIEEHGVKYWCTCDECAHFFVYNYCFGCQQHIFKHGFYWTYHDLDVLDSFHIICPACGAYFERQRFDGGAPSYN